MDQIIETLSGATFKLRLQPRITLYAVSYRFKFASGLIRPTSTMVALTEELTEENIPELISAHVYVRHQMRISPADVVILSATELEVLS